MHFLALEIVRFRTSFAQPLFETEGSTLALSFRRAVNAKSYLAFAWVCRLSIWTNDLPPVRSFSIERVVIHSQYVVSAEEGGHHGSQQEEEEEEGHKEGGREEGEEDSGQEEGR